MGHLEDRTVPATFTVNLTTDASGTAAGTGTGTTGDLRYCIEQADLLAGADDIVFDKTVFTADTTITLNTTAGQLIADGDLTINNDTGKSITLDGSSAIRLLRLNKVGTSTAYTLNNLRFVNGNSAADGGAILAATNDNAAASNMSAVTVTFNGCTISNNTTATQGGGIALGNRITLNMFDSTVSGNSAPTGGPGGTGGTGGGIYASAFGTVHIERSTLSGNLSGGGNGGGALYFYGGLATDKVEIINSTISGNTAFNFGGAIALYAFKNGGSLLVSNSTIVNNSAAPGGGEGISIDFTSANSPITINSSVINANGTVNDLIDNGTNMSITVNSSLIGNPAGFVIDSTDGKNLPSFTNPMLKALGNYGGPTQTHEPMVGSPLIDVGSNPLALSKDQRGGARSFGDPDIGSVELSTPGAPTAAATVSNITKSGGNKISFSVTYTDDVLMDGSTVGAGDIRVLGPGGYNVIATYTGGVVADAVSVVGTYEAPANTLGSANWDFADNGTYNIRIEPGQVKDKAGNSVPSGTVASFTVTAPRPTGLPLFSNVTTPGADFTFQVTWVGVDTKILLSSLGNDDLRVTNTTLGYDAPATFISADKGADDNMITATYKVTGPGGSWDIAGERGQLFNVVAQAGMVVDVDGTAVATGTVGQFAAFLIVDSTAETSDGDFSPGNYTLREAIETANATAHDNDVITFDSATTFATPQTILLTSRLAISGGVVITGPAAQVTLDGGGASALMSLTGAGGKLTNVTLEKLKFANATAQFGAGIDSDGVVVTLNNVIFQDLTGTQGIGIRVRNSLGATQGGLIANNTTWNNVDCTASVAAGNYFGGAAMVVDTDFGTFNNCTFINNDAINPATDGTYFGAAIAIRAVNLTVTNSTFTSNVAEGFGGAIGAIMSGTTSITGSTFTSNVSQTSSGGAILHQGTSPSVTITGSTFTSNKAAGTGGGVDITGGTAGGTRLVDNCTFTTNEAGASGGGLAIVDDTSATVRNSVFFGNKATTVTASSGGGGLSFQGVTSLARQRLIEGCTFENNVSMTSTGGAITHFAGGTVILRNSTLSGNTAATGGGAIRLVSASATAIADFKIQNTTIAFNTSTAGAAISQANTANATFSIESSIVAKNTQTGVGDITSSLPVGLTNSLIGNGDGVTFTTSGTTFVGTTALEEDPGFVGGLASNGATQPGNKTYAISNASKVYNKGSNPASLTTDQRGGTFNRVSGGQADMGSYELQVVVPPTITGITVDDNTGQRSLVRSMVVTFSEPVNYSASSFQLVQTFNGSGTVGLTLSPATGPANSVTITFNNTGTVVLDPQSSLPDGKFQLTINGATVSSGSGTLDGNKNGTSEGSPTDDVVFVTHRLFGDSNGDGSVTASDFNAFRLAYGSAGPSIFDYDGIAGVSASDFNAFRLRYGVTFP